MNSGEDNKRMNRGLVGALGGSTEPAPTPMLNSIQRNQQASLTSNPKIPELPAELRRAAKISTSGYWAGVLLEAADEIEAARRGHETKAEPIDGRDRIEQCVREIQQICDWGNMDASEWLNDETAIGEKPRERPQPIATVIDNNQPGWTNIVETAPNVTLPVGTKLYDQNALLAVGARVVDEIWQRESSEKSGDEGASREAPSLSISKAPQS